MMRYRVDQDITPSAVLENAEAVQVGLMDVISKLLEQKMLYFRICVSCNLFLPDPSHKEFLLIEVDVVKDRDRNQRCGPEEDQRTYL